MHKLLKIAVLFGLSANLSNAFDAMPYELLTKIILLESQALGALCTTSSPMNALFTGWAQKKDKNFLDDAYKCNAKHAVRFVLQHNKKITDVEAGGFAEICWQSPSFLKSISSVRLWATQRMIYQRRECIAPVSQYHITLFVGNGFLIPVYYYGTEAIPTMHALMGNGPLVSSLKDAYVELLKSGMNPFYIHKNRTVVALIEENTHFTAVRCKKDEFKRLCLQYWLKRNNFQAVMYHDSQPLTMDAIEEIARGE